MQFWLLVGLAVGLAMDALAVAISVSIKLRTTTLRQVFRLSFHFGLFQAVMPVLGWAMGYYAAALVSQVDHWVVFFLLSFIGVKAIVEAIWDLEAGEGGINDPTRGLSLVALSVATSLDAFVVGISFAMLSLNVWYAAVMIGVITGALTMVGMLFGRYLGRRLGTTMEVIGGLVLILIGVKTLIDGLAS